MIGKLKRLYFRIARIFRKNKKPIIISKPVKLPDGTVNPNNAILKVAYSLIGTREIYGKKHNELIVEMFKVVAGAKYSDETPWCAAAVGYVLKRAGYNHTGSLVARSYLKYGKPVKLEDALEGDIVIFKRGNSSWQGHVGFFHSFTSSRNINVLGGNQSNEFCIKSYKLSDLLAVRRAYKPNL